MLNQLIGLFKNIDKKHMKQKILEWENLNNNLANNIVLSCKSIFILH